MKIRRYQDKDWQRFKEIHDAARMIELKASNLTDAFIKLEDTYENEGLFEYILLVAEDKNNIVIGFIAFHEEEIVWLYVDPKYHRKGIASKLLDEAVNQAGDKIFIEVLEGNDGARKFYESKGFQLKEKVSGQMVGNETYNVNCYIYEYNK